MAEDTQGGQEKTEEPSKRKREKSAEEGRVLTSKEMFVLTSMCAAFMLMLALAQFFLPLIQGWGRMFHFERPHDLTALSLERLGTLITQIMFTSLMVGIPIMVIIIATQTAIGGLNFAPKAMSFKARRLNPLSGLKRIFSSKGLMELVKAVLKVTLLCGIASIVLYLRWPDLIQLTLRAFQPAFFTALMDFPLLLGMLILGLSLIALLDYFWQRHTHIQSLKMTKQEVKDEYKQTEGSPEVKAKIRRMQMETAANVSKQQKALEDVPHATAIITNPAHFAVALKYDVGAAAPPVILALGRGHMAAQIIERAKQAQINIFRAPLLARALYFTGEIGTEIAEQLYQSVAVILAYLYRLDKGESVTAPEIDLPPEMRFNEYGQPLKAKENA